MFKIISKKRLAKLEEYERILCQGVKGEIEEFINEPVEYHCGYKSCQFHTTSPAGLSIHRAKVHNHK